MTKSSPRLISVVAAENFWGNIASQLGGEHVVVTDLVDNPNSDPHNYEPGAADARAIASADFVIINGIGYDTWATKLVAANPSPSRIVLTVGVTLGVPQDGNPHRWYNPDDVHKIVEAIRSNFKRIDPADAAYFDAQTSGFEASGLAGYKAVITEIRTRFATTPVGASESIFAMLAPALGLRLITPPGFLRAISQGIDPTVADKTTIDSQIRSRAIKVYVYNSQNATPDVQAQIVEARANSIPVTTITETMIPATASWQQWQTSQLIRLRDALAKAVGR
jgi:zinc/manganese transport system substrate-binding protein